MPFDARHFIRLLEDNGYDFFTGVPCSVFEDLLRILDNNPRYGYVGAVREDSAIGIAAGAYLGGRQPVVVMQNSGLAASANALMSLNQIYDIPALLLVSWRGQDGSDAPEHVVMGAVTEGFLQLLDIPHAIYQPATIDHDLASLASRMRTTGKPVAIVVPQSVQKGAVPLLRTL
jgi:phosphonopyruvate decarboxylase